MRVSLFGIVFITWMYSALASVRNSATCDDAADIVLVLDDSESLRRYDSETDTFVNSANYANVVGQLVSFLDSSLQRLAVVAASSTSSTLVTLTDDHGSVIDAINDRTPEFGRQDIHLGIAAATSLLDAGADADATRYIIVFQDGNSQTQADTRANVVSGASNTFLHVSMRSSFSEGAVIAGRDYRSLMYTSPLAVDANATDVATDIANIICPKCKGKGDVIFMLDDSVSTNVSGSYDPVVLDFVQTVVDNKYDALQRRALITFSDGFTRELNLTFGYTIFDAALNSLTPKFGADETDLVEALEDAGTMFDDESLSDEDQKKVVILLDGSVPDSIALSTAATTLRAKDVEFFAMGFSSNVQLLDLLYITNSATAYTQGPSSDILASFNATVTEFLCDAPASLTT